MVEAFARLGSDLFGIVLSAIDVSKFAARSEIRQEGGEA